MSGRLLAARLAPTVRRLQSHVPRRLTLYSTSAAGGLLRTNAALRAARQRTWPPGAYSLHNVPAVRSISFARIIPNLALKLARIPALFGASAIAGLVYLQYQAQRMLRFSKGEARLSSNSNRGGVVCKRCFQPSSERNLECCRDGLHRRTGGL